MQDNFLLIFDHILFPFKVVRGESNHHLFAERKGHVDKLAFVLDGLMID